MSKDYYKELKQKNTVLLRHMLLELPPFMPTFFRGIAERTAPRTRIAYAIDYKVFFTYLTKCCKSFLGVLITDFTLDMLNLVSTDDIEGYMEYLSFYTKEKFGKTVELQNDESGKARKLASIRKLFAYFFKKGAIQANPADRVDFPKLHKKNIIRLEPNEVATLLDKVENGEGLSKGQKKYHGLTVKRDLAIVTLLLGTGMRVSECVGIDVTHVNFEKGCVKVTRKGGDESILYFGDEVKTALAEYVDERLKATPCEGHEGALFLSLQNRRITVRSVQKLVKKYARVSVALKKVSPHKLRSTYGTNLYMESGDIYLVADVLGHTDVNTTVKHYVQMAEERRKQAAKYVVLRSED